MNCRELKWQWPLIRSSVDAVDSDARHGLCCCTGKQGCAAAPHRRSVNAADSEGRGPGLGGWGPTTGAQRRGLSGTTGRQARPEQARGGAATAAASVQLTRRRGVLRQGRRGAAFRQGCSNRESRIARRCRAIRRDSDKPAFRHSRQTCGAAAGQAPQT